MLKKWKLLKKENIFTSKYLGLDKNSYKLPNGKVVDDWYTFSRGNFVLVIAQNSKGEVLLERQYRPAADDFIYELPAGWIDVNESPVDAGIRELEEESGYTGNGKAYGPFYVLPGTSNIYSYVVVVAVEQNFRKDIKREFDEEDIELSFVSRDRINEMILNGEIKDEGLLVGISVLNALKS